MAKYELRDMNGSAFKNKRKERESQPDYTGTMMAFGRECWFNMWYKGKDKNGDPFFTYSLKEKEPRQPKEDAPAKPIEDDDIPF